MSTMPVLVLGKAGSGKSCLSIRLIANRFVEDYEPTMEDVFRKALTVDDKVDVIDIYDTAGIDDFGMVQNHSLFDNYLKKVRDSYMRKGEGFLIVYAINDKSSYEEVTKLHDLIIRVKDKKCPTVLVGTKCDLNDEREVTQEEGEKLAKSIGAKFLEASSFTGHNVEECYAELIREVRKEREKHEDTQPRPKKKDRCSIL